MKYPLKILLAEDNIVNQKITTKFLQNLGYSTDLAENGLEVVEKIKDNSYDIILMDIRMPEMDGIEATKAIINICGKNRPVIIAITADVFVGAREKYLSEGLDDYLPKPVSEVDFQTMFLKWSTRIIQKNYNTGINY